MATPVAVVNEPHALCRSEFIDRLFKGIQNEPGMRGGADAPADDLARINPARFKLIPRGIAALLPFARHYMSSMSCDHAGM